MSEQRNEATYSLTDLNRLEYAASAIEKYARTHVVDEVESALITRLIDADVEAYRTDKLPPQQLTVHEADFCVTALRWIMSDQGANMRQLIAAPEGMTVLAAEISTAIERKSA